MAKVNSVSLTAYTISIKDRADLIRKLLLGSYDGTTDVLDVFENLLGRLTNPADDGVASKVLHLTKLEREDRFLKGIIEAGDYGQRQNIINASTRKSSYKTKKDDAVLTPFYFLLSLPEDKHKGVLMLERVGNRGIYENVRQILSLPFRAKVSNYVLESNALTNSDFLFKLIDESRISSVSFIQTKWSDDLADEIGALPDEKRGHLKVTITAGYNESLPTKIIKGVKRVFNREILPSQAIELEDINPDEMSIEVYFNGKRRTITYSNDFNYRSIFDVTDKIKFGDDGHPTFETIDAAAQDLLEDLARPLYEGNLRE